MLEHRGQCPAQVFVRLNDGQQGIVDVGQRFCDCVAFGNQLGQNRADDRESPFRLGLEYERQFVRSLFCH